MIKRKILVAMLIAALLRSIEKSHEDADEENSEFKAGGVVPNIGDIKVSTCSACTSKRCAVKDDGDFLG